MDKFKFSDILFFNKMITPAFVTFIYWLLMAAVVLSGVVGLFTGKILAFFAIPFVMIGVRIWMELIVVMFSINNNISKLVDKQSRDRDSQ